MFEIRISINFLLILCLFTACDSTKQMAASPASEPNDLPVKKECVDTNKAAEVAWMAKLIEQYEPAEVEKYPYLTDGWAYVFVTANRYMYDCQGTLICTARGRAMDECARKIARLRDAGAPQMVYVREYRQD